jgi:hypothetical protein
VANIGDFLRELMDVTSLNHQVAQNARNVIAVKMQEIARVLDKEVNENPRIAVLHGLTSRVFSSCQYPESRTEAVYVVTAGGNVMRIRVDAFEVENAVAAIANDPNTDDVREYIAGMVAELNTRANG